MALVRKFQEAGKIESNKKVLVYENVGNYDAEKLASALTLDLEDQAKSLDLSGKDRQAFMQYGAEMIQAIKDGNVTKNADGSFSIKGNYGLNNRYSSTEVAEKFANGEVGYGARKYEGTYLKSHGIFTTNETRDFRHRNHILGLVGQWVNNNLKEQSVIKEEESKESEEDKKFNFKDTFVNANLAGNSDLLSDWKTLVNTLEGRNAALVKAIDSLSNEDFEAWALENPNLGSAADLLKAMGPLKEALSNNDIKKAQELAFNLGISLNDFIISDNQSTTGEQQTDQYVELAKRALTSGENSLANPTPELIAQYAEYLRQQGKYQVEKAINARFNAVVASAWEAELSKLRQAILDNPISYDSLLDDKAYDPKDKDSATITAELKEILNSMSNMRDYIDELGPYVDPNLQILFGELLDQLGDTYDALTSGKIKYAEGFKDAWFQDIADGEYKGKVILKWLQTDKYSIIYDPTKHKFYRIPNQLLPETELFNILKNAFESQFRQSLEQTEEVPSEKKGGILKYKIGGGMGDATTLDWGSKKIDPSKPVEIDLANAKEVAGMGNEHYEPANSNKPKPQYKPREIHSLSDIETEDVLRVLSTFLDLASLYNSETGLLSGGLGLASTALDVGADIADENISAKLTIKNGIIGTAADLFSLIPFAKTSKAAGIIQRARDMAIRFGPLVTGALNVYYTAELAQEISLAWDRFINNKMEASDIMLVCDAFRAVFGGIADVKRAHSLKKYANLAQVTGTLIMDTNGKWYPISDEALAEIKKLKDTDLKKANELFRLHTLATTDLPIITENRKNSKTKKKETVSRFEINTRPKVEVPESFIEDGLTGQRVTYVPSTDLQFFNQHRLPTVSQWLRDKNNRFTRWVDRKRGFTILPFENMPTRAKKLSDTSFELDGATYRKRDDGLYYMESPAPRSKKEVAPAPESTETKKQGGSLGFARETITKMRNGGPVQKMQAGGWFKVVDNSNKDHYFKSKEAADWFREYNNITAESEAVDSNAYDYDWDLSNIYNEWDQSDYKKGNSGIPYNKNQGLTALDLEADLDYKDFTNWIISSLREGKGNAYNAAIDYLKKMAARENGLNYFKSNGELIDNYDKILLSYYYDHKRGYHHHKANRRSPETLYYLNGLLVSLDDIKDLSLDHEFTQESLDKTRLHKFYVTDKAKDPENSEEEERLDPAQESGENDNLEYNNNLNWGNISEAGRVLWLNGQNARAAKLSMNWTPALAGYIHRNEILEGDYEALKAAESGQAKLNSKTGQTFSTSPELLLAALLLATDQGNQIMQKAALADSNKFYDSRHKIQSLQNEDLLYNRKVADTNRAAIADKEKSDANIKANLTLENATNLSNMWAGISKQIMDGYDRRKQQLLHYEMKRAANRQAVAASIYNARRAALDTSDKEEYAKQLQKLGKEYMESLDKSSIQELNRTRRLLGPDILYVASLARKGRRLTADLRYILSGSLDFNRRKLSDAKEFYKNIRETQKKRKS